MLILSRSVGQKIRISPRPGLAGDTPICELFKDGAIEIVLINVSKIRNGVTQAHIGIDAHPDFAIVRSELENGTKK
jgi:sRNA-binding carbon storage regulator CsrA